MRNKVQELAFREPLLLPLRPTFAVGLLTTLAAADADFPDESGFAKPPAVDLLAEDSDLLKSLAGGVVFNFFFGLNAG